jgi:hypothetical protein
MSPDDYISSLSQAFSTGRYDALVEHYRFPMPIYVNRSATVANGRDDAQGFYRALHRLVRAQGYETLSGRIVSVELPKRNRFRLWAEWSGVDGARRELLFRSVCFNAGTFGNHRTEMLTLESRKLPGIESLLEAA